MTREAYLNMCETLGSEPIEEEIPLEFQDFPPDVQQALEIFMGLTSTYEGMSGTYMGKDMSLIPFLFEMYDIEDKKAAFLVIQMANRVSTEVINSKQKSKQDAKAKAQNNLKGFKKR